MLKIKKISEVLGKQVYTSEGDFLGVVEEVNLVDNKIDGWRIRVGSGFMGSIGGARGVIIPHQFVKSIGDVFVVNSAAFRGVGVKDEMPVDVSSSSDTDDLI
ncbi:PRC-barrel domain-containing protein [Candidatus Pacearchaeota archaeon]|nr:PRC-barrel domain-containing protein [Candidatus Pacearchaeota archaeon]